MLRDIVGKMSELVEYENGVDVIHNLVQPEENFADRRQKQATE